MRKQYIGDGVYAEFDENLDVVILTTENGIAVTNQIVLDADTWLSLHAVVDHWMRG